MEAIKIIRLKEGLDLVSYVDDETIDEMILRDPMIIDSIVQNGIRKIVLHFWLPNDLILNSECVLKKEEVLTTMMPKASFSEYYMNTILIMNTTMLQEADEPDNLTSEEMNIILHHMDTDGKVRH